MLRSAEPEVQTYSAVVGGLEQHQTTHYATDGGGTMYCRRCGEIAEMATIVLRIVAEKSPREDIRQEPYVVFRCLTCERVSPPPDTITCCL